MEAKPSDPAEALRPRRHTPLRFARLPGGRLFDVMADRPLGGRVRAVRRLVSAVAWTLLALPVQALLLLLPGHAKRRFPRLYWGTMCRLIGVRVRVIGAPPPGGRVLYLSNHTSWLDILVLGGVLEACFVSKSEVGQWPLIGTVARLGRTLFVSRSRGRTGGEAQEIRARLEAGDSVLLFPEGTSSDGTRVLPFRSSFLGVAASAARVQAVTVVYDRLGGLPALRRDRPLFAWYGDMDIASHFWRLARRAGAGVTVLLHEPASPADFADRKVLTASVQAAVSRGADALRQNRAAEPLALARPAPARAPSRAEA